MHHVRILICAAVAVLIAQAAGSYFQLPVVQYAILFVAVVAVATVCRPWYDPENTRAEMAEADRHQLEKDLAALRQANEALQRENTRLREALADTRDPALLNSE